MGSRGNTQSNSLGAKGSWSDSDDYKDFMKKNMKQFKETGIRSHEDARDEWYKTRMKATEKEIKALSKEEAIEAIREGVPSNLRHGWFVEADSNYKPSILEQEFKNSKTRNGALNIAYYNYIEETGNNISFQKFLDTPITLYRGTNGQKTMREDRWHSFSYNKNIAKKFGDNIQTIKIKPKDTFGSMQTTGETEVLVPDFMLKKINKRR